MGSIRKVNYPDSWNDHKVISMYTKLKDCVDAGLKMKKQGARKRLCLPRDLEPIVREIFEKKRGITFRTDTGGCEPAQDSKHFPDADWCIKGWFDAAKICVNVLLKSDFKRASSSSGGGAGGGPGGRAGGNAHAPGRGGAGGGGGRPAEAAAAAAAGPGAGVGVPSSWSQKQSLRDGFRVSEGAKENRKRPLEHEHHEGAPRQGHPGRQNSWPPPSQPHGNPPQLLDPQSYSAAASADTSVHQEQQQRQQQPSEQPRIKLPRTPSFSAGGASRPQPAREPLFDSAAVLPSDERVPVHALTTWGAARMVEEALRKQQPSRVHWGAHYTAAHRVVVEGLTGQDLAQCDGPDLGGFIKGPASKLAAVSSAVDEYLNIGGVSRARLREWGQAPPGQPLPAASSSAAAPSEPPSDQHQQLPQHQQLSAAAAAAAGGGGGVVRSGWGAPPRQPKQERP